MNTILRSNRRMNNILIAISLSIAVCWPSESAVASEEPLYDSMMTIYLTRNYDSAIVFANQALITLDNSGHALSKQSARIQHRMAACYQQQDNRQEAIRMYERAISTWRSLTDGDPIGLAASLGNLGRIYGEQGRFSESESVLLEAVSLKEQFLSDTAISLARTYQKVGGFYRMTGDYKQAEHYHIKAHRIYSSGSSRWRVNLLLNQNDLAVVYHLQNRFEDAVEAYEVVIDGLKGIEFPGKWNGVLGTLGNLATLKAGLREFSEATDLFNYGLLIIDSLSLNLPERRAQFRGYLGRTFFQMDRFAEAEENIVLSLTILDSIWKPGNPQILERQNTLANIFRETKRLSKADSLYSLVLNARIERLGGRHPDVGLTYLAWSRLKEKIGAIDSALELSQNAYSVHRRNFFEGVQVLSEDDALSYARDMRVAGLQVISLGLRMSSLPVVSLSTLSTIKGAVTDQLISRNKFLRKINDKSIRKLAQKHREVRARIVEITIMPPPGLDNQQVVSIVDSLTGVAERIEGKLSREGNVVQSYSAIGEVNIDSVMAAIPPNNCLVEFLRAENIWSPAEQDFSAQYVAMILGHNSERKIISLGSAIKIDSVVGLYRSHFLDVASRERYPTAEDAEAYDSIARTLYEMIWRPLELSLDAYETVIVAPDGALNLVSFAGLKNSASTYLIEEKSIQYVGAGRDLLRPVLYSDQSGGLLAFGDPDYDATALQRKSAFGVRETATDLTDESGQSFLKATANDCFDLASISVSPLPSSGTEVQLVAEVWKNNPDLGPALAFYQSAASEDNFKRFAGKQSIIHLSTHGYYLRADCKDLANEGNVSIDPLATRVNPLIYSGLLLAGSNLHGEGSNDAGVEDGILTAEEISAINLEGVNTVVLSACETGLGDIRQNEGVYGLRRAFQMAGASTVVSALWKVPSEETTTFFAELYKNSSEPLSNRLRWLQLAQIAKFRAAGFADHPFAWGAFIAVGRSN